MKMTERLIAAINEQINKELYSAYLYRSMSLDTAERALDGVTKWLTLQSREEMGHAEAMISYLEGRGVRPELKPIAEVPNSFGTLREILTQSLRHEQSITKSIEEIVKMATEDHDYGVRIFFEKFVVEQEEEEENAQHNLDRLALIGDGAVAIFDQEMGMRE